MSDIEPSSTDEPTAQFTETDGRCPHFVPPRRCYLPAGHEGDGHPTDPTEPVWIGLSGSSAFTDGGA